MIVQAATVTGNVPIIKLSPLSHRGFEVPFKRKSISPLVTSCLVQTVVFVLWWKMGWERVSLNNNSAETLSFHSVFPHWVNKSFPLSFEDMHCPYWCRPQVVSLKLNCTQLHTCTLSHSDLNLQTLLHTTLILPFNYISVCMCFLCTNLPSHSPSVNILSIHLRHFTAK